MTVRASFLCLAKRFLCVSFLVAVAATGRWAQAVPVYQIVPLGLAGAEHTRNDGYKYSFARELNEAGQVSGDSERYNGGSAILGTSAWFYDGTTTTEIGLMGSEHTRNDGYRINSAGELNDAGLVAGFSKRYKGGSDSGSSAWLYDGAATIDIGLVGSEHTRNDGYKSSAVELHGLTETGQVVGYSGRYNGGSTNLGRTVWFYDGATTNSIGLTGREHTRNDGYKSGSVRTPTEEGIVLGHSFRYNGGSTDLGQSAWLYNGAATVRLGLVGFEHTRNNGFKHSSGVALNEMGHVSGNSNRYNGNNTQQGTSAWLYDGSTTINVGLVGSEHTSSSGYKDSRAGALNQAGDVIGYSDRYNNGSTPLGASAWFYDGTTTINIGLTGGEYTRHDDYKFSRAERLNEAGEVIGYSSRYNGSSAYLGRTAWLYDGATTINIGLMDSEHARTDGYKYSVAQQLNAAGQAGGHSDRFHGSSTYFGRTAWLYDGATTIAIGLKGSEHTRNDGYKNSATLGLNEAGQVHGYSQRFNGDSVDSGRDAWFYDPMLDQTLSLQLSTRSDGYAFSEVGYLGEDGLTLGLYTLFDSFDNNLGYRAFYFTPADGLHDLGSLVGGGLSPAGWDWLASAIRASGLSIRTNDKGQILGQGKLISQSDGQMVYLLTPVPEAGSEVLVGLAVGGLVLLWTSTGVRRSRRFHSASS
ncbi:MAG: hypothetical protein WD851_00595 [Pirellulales bacterium]